MGVGVAARAFGEKLRADRAFPTRSVAVQCSAAAPTSGHTEPTPATGGGGVAEAAAAAATGGGVDAALVHALLEQIKVVEGDFAEERRAMDAQLAALTAQLEELSAGHRDVGGGGGRRVQPDGGAAGDGGDGGGDLEAVVAADTSSAATAAAAAAGGGSAERAL